ncbi:YcgN family cysteine cluster protein [Simiduia sp. 21SJ11W-1]|uniref:YcgN family cysteine cluster protein n=1 Tax=Simiduia sp. 21SJ11W-1 TaxID=2909669 RepID=UPI00209F1B50|nr:YcgN family cysteine cluster protein [Simiduia sp. 21SJ11W-1]UTA48927.1 YcgN family cysteine cluster protein [Simiduia sp. 21SJ11W-1]
MAWFRDYWREVPLAEMTDSQWEALCDGCGKCCLQKLEDEDDGEVYYTRLACELLDLESCRCTDYPNRLQKVPDCLQLRAEKITEFHWLPVTCAYRLVAEGQDLPEWHPLISGSPATVHSAGISVRGRAKSMAGVPEDQWQEDVVHWVDL